MYCVKHFKYYVHGVFSILGLYICKFLYTIRKQNPFYCKNFLICSCLKSINDAIFSVTNTCLDGYKTSECNSLQFITSYLKKINRI